MLEPCYNYNEFNNINISALAWNVAIYVRLSREDYGTGQSESIENQIRFLSSYVEKQDWNLIKIYSDDGYTGTNFDRPGFKEMIQDIELGLINLIITKDLSRLGREHIDTSHYIERYFPEKNIRYIAVNDNIDTFDNRNTNNEMTPFKSVVNDMYARDISKKVKTALMTKAMNGESIKPFEPYGYKKDPKNKNKIVIDEDVAGNVAKIFDLYHSGLTKKQICDYLEEHNILTPLKYKEETTNYKNPNYRIYKWNSTSVNKILRNRIYVGDLVQNKTQKVSYKIDKRIKNHPSKHIIVPNNHEAIVDRDLFNTVQDMLDKQTNEWSYLDRPPHLLQGLAFCSCEARITYNKNHGKYSRCVCSRYKNKGTKFCNNIGYLKEDDLIEDVIEKLRCKIQSVLSKTDLDYNVGATCGRPPDRSKTINKKIVEINNLLKNIYEDKVNNVISQETFVMLSKDYENQKSKLLKQLQNDIDVELGLHNNHNIDEQKFKQIANQILQLKNPKEAPRSLLNKLINRIIIDDKNVSIEYNFKLLNA